MEEFEHLNLLKKYIKNQEASSILRMGFALSKWPHLHRAYLLASRLNWPALYTPLQSTNGAIFPGSGQMVCKLYTTHIIGNFRIRLAEN